MFWGRRWWRRVRIYSWRSHPDWIISTPWGDALNSHSTLLDCLSVLTESWIFNLCHQWHIMIRSQKEQMHRLGLILSPLPCCQCWLPAVIVSPVVPLLICQNEVVKSTSKIWLQKRLLIISVHLNLLCWTKHWITGFWWSLFHSSFSNHSGNISVSLKKPFILLLTNSRFHASNTSSVLCFTPRVMPAGDLLL